MAEEYAGSRVYEALVQRLGFGVTTVESEIVVTSGGTLLVRPNPRRFELIIVNHGLTEVRLGLSMRMAQTTGVLVPRQGGMIVILFEEDAELSTYAWYAASLGSDCTMYVLEVIAQ